MRGDCFTCSKVQLCSETSAKRIREGYTCDLFTSVPEPVYKARVEMMLKYGEEAAVEAMMERPQDVQEGEN